MHGATACDSMEDALVNFGRWVLVSIFNDDASAALDGKRSNPVWHELVRRAGGPTLHLSRKLLYVAIQIAAHDKRINDEAWRKLEPGRKELLLPIGDERVMREAAQRVLAAKMTHRATRAYVQTLREEFATSEAPSRITPKSLLSRLRGLRETVATEAATKKITASLATAKAVDRQQVLRELKALEKWAVKVRNEIER